MFPQLLDDRALKEVVVAGRHLKRVWEICTSCPTPYSHPDRAGGLTGWTSRGEGELIHDYTTSHTLVPWKTS